MVLVFEVFGWVFMVVINLPWHRAIGNGNFGFRGSGCGFAAEVEAGEAESTGHDA